MNMGTVARHGMAWLKRKKNEASVIARPRSVKNAIPQAWPRDRERGGGREGEKEGERERGREGGGGHFHTLFPEMKSINQPINQSSISGVALRLRK